jgi:hypothetical protein
MGIFANTLMVHSLRKIYMDLDTVPEIEMFCFPSASYTARPQFALLSNSSEMHPH